MPDEVNTNPSNETTDRIDITSNADIDLSVEGSENTDSGGNDDIFEGTPFALDGAAPDLKVASPADVDDAGEPDGDKETPTGDEDPLAKRGAEIAAREAALEKRERELVGGQVKAGSETSDETLASEGTQDTSAQDDSETFSQRWAKQRDEIVKTWDEYDAPGERVLVGIIDQFAPALDEVREIKAYVQAQQAAADEYQTRQTATVIARNATETAKILTEEFGEEVTPEAVMAAGENGGIVAYAATKGTALEGLDVTVDVLKASYLLKHVDKVGKRKPAVVRPARDLTDGGAPRVETAPTNDDDDILASIQAAGGGFKN